MHRRSATAALLALGLTPLAVRAQDILRWRALGLGAPVR